VPKFGEATFAVLNITILRKRIRWSARCQIQRICSFDTGEKKLNAARSAESMTQPPVAHVLLIKPRW